MTVGKLIEELSKYDKDTQVVLPNCDWTYYTPKLVTSGKFVHYKHNDLVYAAKNQENQEDRVVIQ